MVATIFERFVHESPVAVMVRATLENAFSAPALDRLFVCTAEQQYTRTLLFSTVVELMTTVVLRQEQSLHAAFQQRRHILVESRRAGHDLPLVRGDRFAQVGVDAADRIAIRRRHTLPGATGSWVGHRPGAGWEAHRIR